MSQPIDGRRGRAEELVDLHRIIARKFRCVCRYKHPSTILIHKELCWPTGKLTYRLVLEFRFHQVCELHVPRLKCVDFRYLWVVFFLIIAIYCTAPGVSPRYGMDVTMTVRIRNRRTYRKVLVRIATKKSDCLGRSYSAHKERVEHGR
jgi:hypothetical protein